MNEITTYERLGGEEGLKALVDRFYDLMDQLPEAKTIRDLHAKDLKSSREKLFKFLSGFFGGPDLFVQQYGHPMLRRRHLPFQIGEDERDQWLLCMSQAIEELITDPELALQLRVNFARTADHMRNVGPES
ncbi:Group 2 truncated hemoglobin YjbI [Rubripirellula obstinata]|uniref:Group 2 truncated hemoglobin YjbI n=1 Tax=Rubripirellula obstinata TaxID=406547 RepID=A0A5B1CQV3_9BACT|nr:group II truncated hemoglobin [Rubripirellula obstinata]KAA1262345.1 Group 2 truncated hemoglobin YjbI [Rubripirellula obstinata]